MPYLAAIGTFDGVHRGHQALLNRLKRQARKLGMRSMVVLFSEPPRFYFLPKQATELITLPKERTELLTALGIDKVRVLSFGKHWAEMSHERFFENFLLKQCGIRGLVVGPDFAFGKERLGNVTWLKDACRLRHIYFQVQPLLLSAAWKVSSTRIRDLLLEGKVEEAALLLGRPYYLSGQVKRGQGLGRTIGVPTANLQVHPHKLLPRGVYTVSVSALGKMPPRTAVHADVRVGGPEILKKERVGVCNIGIRPTVGGKHKVHTEVHIPRFKGNLYGKTLKIEFLRHLRPEKKFPSLAALKAQILRDIKDSLR